MSDAPKIPTAAEIADDVGFTEPTLNDNMMRQAGLYVHYGRLAAEMAFEAEVAKQRLEITEASTAQKIRDAYAESGEKVTEKKIEQDLAVTRAVVAAKRAMHRAKAEAEAAKSALEALRHKKDMMIQFGVQRRTEMETGARISERSTATVDRAKTERDANKEKLEEIKKRANAA